MRIVVLRSAYEDLAWFRRYYTATFPGGAARATEHYREALERIADMPLIGVKVPDRSVRVYPISRTPFLLIYRVAEDRVDVLRVWDARRERAEG